MSQDPVKALPMVSRTTMSLDEIQQAMAALPPRLVGFRGGWASTNNLQSNLGQVGLEPPASEPIITEATDLLPRMIRARFYFWDIAPSIFTRQPDHDPMRTRKLSAIDVTITQVDSSHIGMLFSTRTRQYLNKQDGIIKSLEKILQRGDETIKVERNRSHLALHDAEIFLWLTVQQRDQAQVAPDLTLDLVSGISGTDSSSRTADLRSGVDFDRPNFLTSVAEADTLGPIDISFVHHTAHENHSYLARVHADGGFEIRRSSVHIPSIVDGNDLMIEAALRLAYVLIPRLNELYKADAVAWAERRVVVIREAMEELERRYRALRDALEIRTGETLESVTAAP